MNFRWLSHGISAGLGGIALCTFHLSAQLPERSSDPTSYGRTDLKSESDPHGQVISPLNRQVSLKLDAVPLKEALHKLGSQSGVKLVFGDDVLKVEKRITLKVAGMTVDSLLRLMLKDTDVSYRVVENAQVFLFRGAAKKDTVVGTGSLGGRVVDSAGGKGIANVTFSIQRTKLSGTTNSNGEFTIANVPAGEHRVTFKLIGYEGVTRTVVVDAGKRTTLSVALKEAVSMLSEVVTTVTGAQRKLEVGNDITTIDVPEVMKQAPITSVTDLLEARVPGLTVMRTSGVPGAPSRIRLRGIGGGLLSGVSGAPTNDPIVIVDGIRIYAGQSGVDDQKLGGGKYPTPSPIDQIDPNSIEKIEVLRGPSASAMYGSDAGDGVIVITTKKGIAGASRWDISASKGIETMAGGYAAPGFYRFGHVPRGTLTAASPFCTTINSSDPESYFTCVEDSVVRFQALNEPRLSTIGRGTNTRISSTVSGGTKGLTYSVTGSLANSLGLTKMPPLYQDLFKTLYDSAPSERMKRPNTLNSKSGQASFTGEFPHSLTATYTTFLSQSIQNQSSANEQLSNLSSVYMDTNNISPGRPGQYAYQLITKLNSSKHALSLNLNRFAWFPLTGTFGMDRLEGSAEGLTPRGIWMVASERWGNSPLPGVTSVMSKGKYTERHQNNSTNTGRINGTLFPGSRISLSLGSELTQRSNSAIEGQSDTLTEGISRPSTLLKAGRDGRTTTTGGWFVEPRLKDMNSRFFVNPGFRLDGGSSSGSSSGFRGGLYSLFPKLNFSWIAIDREGNDPLFGAISLFRPRVAFGVAGVQPAAEMSLRTLEQHTGGRAIGEDFGAIGAPDLGLRLRSVGNTKLGPEKIQEIEGGFDMQLWETRLSLSATGFYKIRKNAIEKLPLAPSVGAVGGVVGVGGGDGGSYFTNVSSLSYYSNVGHVRNTGAEITINAMVLDLPNFGWNIDLSVSKYSNTLTKLFGERRSLDIGNGTRLVEGYPLFSRWSRPISGWTEPTNGSKLWYGDYTVADSAVYMGMQAPDFEMPFRTSITLLRGRLTLNAQFNYKAGLTQNNLGGGALLGNIYDNPNSTYGQQAYALAASCFPSIDRVVAPATGIKSCTDYGFIQKINSFRFNSMSVGYNVPREYLKRLPMSSLSLSLQGSNLGLWTNYRGKDPDVNGNLIGDVTQDSGQLPMPRTWILQLRIGT